MKKFQIPAEISWLSFNSCILEEANDKSNPLYERIKFLAIHSSNLDEFFRVKINKLQFNTSNKKQDLLNQVLEEVNQQQQFFGKIWNDSILPELADNKIVYYENQELLNEHIQEIDYYFKSIILSYIQVVYISEKNKKNFFLNNRSLYLWVKLDDEDNNYPPAMTNGLLTHLNLCFKSFGMRYPHAQYFIYHIPCI